MGKIMPKTLPYIYIVILHIIQYITLINAVHTVPTIDIKHHR